MVSVAERRLAAKNKLEEIAVQRRSDQAAKLASSEARAAAKAEKKAKAERLAIEPEANATKGADVAKKPDLPPEHEKIQKRKRREKPKKVKRIKRELVPTSVPDCLGADAYRETHNIIVKRGECCPPVETFEAAEPQVGSHFLQMLRDRGFFAPTPIQAQTWPLALAGQDVVAIAQTGSGKTFAFLLPLLVRLQTRGKPSTASYPATPGALIVAPTRELIQQTTTELSKFAISISRRFVPCFGGVWKGDQLKQLGKGCDILLSTPGRLKDFMVGKRAEGEEPAISVANVSYLVLDEADAMLAMGFEPQVREIMRRCLPTGACEQGGGAAGPRAGTARQTLFFTATWPKRVVKVARELTSDDAVQIRIGQGVGSDKLTANENVRQVVQMVEYWDKSARLANVLTSELKAGDTCVVFCGTKGRTEYVVHELQKAKVVDWCHGIHSGKDQWVRDASLQQFREHTASGECRAVLVATDVAARGLDIPGVALVVVYDLNGWNGEMNIDSYVHRIGRTGRAGKMGRAFTFVESKDRGIPDLVKLLQDAGQRVPEPLQTKEVDERAPLANKKQVTSADDSDTDGEEDEGYNDDGEEWNYDKVVKTRSKAKVDDENCSVDGKAKGKHKDKGKGKSNGKDKGKDKGDGKDKGKHKGKDKGKGKGKEKGKDKGRSKGKYNGKGKDNDSE